MQETEIQLVRKDRSLAHGLEGSLADQIVEIWDRERTRRRTRTSLALSLFVLVSPAFFPGDCFFVLFLFFPTWRETIVINSSVLCFTALTIGEDVVTQPLISVFGKCLLGWGVIGDSGGLP